MAWQTGMTSQTGQTAADRSETQIQVSPSKIIILSNMVALKLFFLFHMALLGTVLSEKVSMRAFRVRQKRDTESLGTGGLVAIVLGICMACCSSSCCIACYWLIARQRHRMEWRLPADYNLQNPPIYPSLPPMLGVDLLSAPDQTHESSTYPSKKD
ncbi:unnamed protein product, partial [Mesorhabditis belari]|uniref:Uncharacterized protein n=1 Tax=Mesorhabditis belari TaxID=2138241 RepID=A0AAF3FGQ4_9BILA